MTKTTITFFAAVTIMLCLPQFLTSCSRASAPEEQPSSFGEQPVAIDLNDSLSLDEQLSAILQDRYGADILPARAAELFLKAVEDHPSLTLNDYGIFTSDNLSSFFKTAPVTSIKEVLQRANQQAREEICEENALPLPENIPASVKAKHPILPLQTKLRTRTTYGREVQGVLLDRNSEYVKIGSKRYARTDFPMDVRIQLFEADRDAELPVLIKDEISSVRAVIKSKLPQKQKEIIPSAFKSAGYVPNPFLADASFQAVNPELWISRPALYEHVTALLKNEKAEYIQQFWTEKGYEKRTTAQGTEWVKAKGK